MVCAVQSISSSKDFTAFDFIELSKRRARADMRRQIGSCKGDVPAAPRHKLLQGDSGIPSPRMHHDHRRPEDSQRGASAAAWKTLQRKPPCDPPAFVLTS